MYKRLVTFFFRIQCSNMQKKINLTKLKKSILLKNTFVYTQTPLQNYKPGIAVE